MGGFSSMSHWLIVLLIVVLLFGAKKIPELAKGLGSGIKNFKNELKDDSEKQPDAIAKTDATPADKAKDDQKA